MISTKLLYSFPRGLEEQECVCYGFTDTSHFLDVDSALSHMFHTHSPTSMGESTSPL